MFFPDVSFATGPQTSTENFEDPYHSTAGAEVLDVGGGLYPGIARNV